MSFRLRLAMRIVEGPGWDAHIIAAIIEIMIYLVAFAILAKRASVGWTAPNGLLIGLLVLATVMWRLLFGWSLGAVMSWAEGVLEEHGYRRE